MVRRTLRRTLDCYYVFVAFNFSTNFGLDTQCLKLCDKGSDLGGVPKSQLAKQTEGMRRS